MKYEKTTRLKDGREYVIRNGVAADGAGALANFRLAHEQTDFLLSYPDESKMTAEQEAEFLQAKTDSDREVELVAVVDGEIVGMAGVSALGVREKVRHRADFGVSIDRAYWGLGIGTALLDACIECAREAGYEQLELDVVAENGAAIHMYEKAGFVEFGRNPRGFRSRYSGYQEVVSMRLELG